MAEKPAPRKRPAPEKQMLEAYKQALPLTEEKLEAYAQVQDIAVKAIEGSSNFKSLTSLGQLLSEQSRRQPAEK
jgi:hypothetical protein